MSLITAINVTLSFFGKEIFDNIGFQVEPGDHVGLVGPNGSGKTSLLRLLAGQMSPDKGEIRVSSGTRIGYLPQDLQETLSGSLLQSTLDSIPGRVRLGEEIAGTENTLKESQTEKEKEKLAARLARAHQEMNHLDTQFPPYRAEKILEGLGFSSDDFDNPISTLSGGWKMRAALGGILYRDPDLLLLDEPTNHLDILSVHWLEQFLREYRGALILVCHDREFLNRQIDGIISFEKEGMMNYNGNYDSYLNAREEEQKTLEARARNREMKIKEAKKFIDRFRAKNTKARQAQSKIKMIEKMELVKTHKKEKSIRFSFPQVSRSGRVTLAIRKVSKGYGEKILYRDLDLTVSRGDRVALIGPNGAGKTTLLRLVADEIKADQGEVSLGHGVTMSYYAQHHSETLNPKKTIIDEVYQAVPQETVGYVRNVCGAFLFSGEDVDKTVGVLSGGEKARVCLAKILVNSGNLLVMDEPSNHLDIISSEILIEALSDYNGTMLFVSHNQSFINKLATKIWDIKDGKILEYPGSLTEYYDHLARLDDNSSPARELENIKGKNKAIKPANRDPSGRKLKRKEKAEKRYLINAVLKPIEEKLTQLEERISDLETREKELGKILADQDIFRDESKSLPILDEYSSVRKKIKELMGRWEYQQNQLESTKKELGA